MKMIFRLTSLSVTVFLAASVYAQQPMPTSTAAMYGGDPLPLGQRMVCSGDIVKLCGDYARNGGDPANDSRALKCLHDNQSNLSSKCLKLLNNKDNNPDWNNSDTNWNTYVEEHSTPQNKNPVPNSLGGVTQQQLTKSPQQNGTPNQQGGSTAPSMLITMPQNNQNGNNTGN